MRSRCKCTYAAESWSFTFQHRLTWSTGFAETSAAIADLERQLEAPRTDAKPERAGRRGNTRSLGTSGPRSEVESEGDPASDSEQPGHSG